MKKVDGKITISRWTGAEDSEVTIRIEDSISGCNIAEIQMSVKDFAEVMFGRSCMNCTIDLFNSYSQMGKYPIRKTIWITDGPFGCDRKALAKEAASFHVNAGWVYSSNQLGNMHYGKRVDNETLYPVYLTKFVDTLKEQEEYNESVRVADESNRINRPIPVKPRKARKMDMER